MALKIRNTSILFPSSDGRHRNDLLTLGRNFGPHGRAFHRAGHSLAQKFLEGRGNFIDGDGLPVVYLYRHALELYLKGIILAGNRFMRRRGEGLPENEVLDLVTSGHGHVLTSLLPEIEKVFLWHANVDEDDALTKTLAEIRFDEDYDANYNYDPIKAFADVVKYLKEIDRVDPRSVAFRYPVGRSKPHEPPLKGFAFSVEGADFLGEFFGYSVNRFLEIIDPLARLLGDFVSSMEEWEEAEESGGKRSLRRMRRNNRPRCSIRVCPGSIPDCC